MSQRRSNFRYEDKPITRSFEKHVPNESGDPGEDYLNSNNYALKGRDMIAFRNELKQNPYFEKEEKYVRENLELEKKSSQLFEKFDNYAKSRKFQTSASVSLYNYGNGGDPDSEIGAGDGHSAFGDAMSYTEDVEDDFNDDGRSNYSIPAFSTTKLSQKLQKLSASPSENMLVGKKQPSRLQRATESVIKSLQCKLLNHEERLADLHLQYRQKIQENTMSESKVKVLEEEREKLLKTIGSLQQTVEKHARHAESSKNSFTIKDQTVTSLRKEIDDLKRENRKCSSGLQNFQTRFQRATEENERLKAQNKSMQQNIRELQSESKHRVDELTQKIVELEKQRSLLTSTVNRQNNIIKTGKPDSKVPISRYSQRKYSDESLTSKSRSSK